jgi:uncharacterized protein with GYD domain
MASYVVLGRLTTLGKQRGAEAMKARDQVYAEFQKKGFKIADYMTLGPYEVVMVVEAPSEEGMMKFLMAVGAGGHLDTTTLRAFTAQETERIVRTP